jgi:hypothetical protein
MKGLKNRRKAPTPKESAMPSSSSSSVYREPLRASHPKGEETELLGSFGSVLVLLKLEARAKVRAAATSSDPAVIAEPSTRRRSMDTLG